MGRSLHPPHENHKTMTNETQQAQNQKELNELQQQITDLKTKLDTQQQTLQTIAKATHTTPKEQTKTGKPEHIALTKQLMQQLAQHTLNTTK